MCGGFSIYNLRDNRLSKLVGNDEINALPQPLYNARPGNFLPIILSKDDKITTARAYWGFRPSWAAGSLINAQAEKITTSNYWKRFQNNRCLIPCNGFFEWEAQATKRYPHYYVDKTRPLFFMAGLFEDQKGPKGYNFINFVIITTKANTLVGKIHPRMPAVLSDEGNRDWLNSSKKGVVKELLTPYPSSKMNSFRVSEKVNNASNNDETLIYPI